VTASAHFHALRQREEDCALRAEEGEGQGREHSLGEWTFFVCGKRKRKMSSAKTQEVVEYVYETASDDDSGDEYEEEEEEVVIVKEAGKKRAERPCNHYRVDTQAAKFGDCVCGWPKLDHAKKKENKASLALKSLRKTVTDKDPVSTSDGPCSHFRVDVTAEKFGTCKCGYHQSEHKAKGENPARLALKSLKSAKNVAPIEKTGQPCNNYVENLSATAFQTCRCGHPKAAHVQKEEDAAAVMLRNLKEKNKARHEKEDRLAAGLPDEPGTKSKKKGSRASKAASADGGGGQAAAGGGCCVIS